MMGCVWPIDHVISLSARWPSECNDASIAFNCRAQHGIGMRLSQLSALSSLPLSLSLSQIVCLALLDLFSCRIFG